MRTLSTRPPQPHSVLDFHPSDLEDHRSATVGVHDQNKDPVDGLAVFSEVMSLISSDEGQGDAKAALWTAVLLTGMNSGRLFS